VEIRNSGALQELSCIMSYRGRDSLFDQAVPHEKEEVPGQRKRWRESIQEKGILGTRTEN